MTTKTQLLQRQDKLQKQLDKINGALEVFDGYGLNDERRKYIKSLAVEYRKIVTKHNKDNGFKVEMPKLNISLSIYAHDIDFICESLDFETDNSYVSEFNSLLPKSKQSLEHKMLVSALNIEPGDFWNYYPKEIVSYAKKAIDNNKEIKAWQKFIKKVQDDLDGDGELDYFDEVYGDLK